MKKYLLSGLGLLILILLVVSGYLLLSNNVGKEKNEQTTAALSKTTKEIQQIIANTKTVRLTKTGFEPKIIEITTGTRVLWTNTSGGDGSVNSDPYPTNGLWRFLNLGLFKNGENMTLIFEKPGKYTYHNQLKPEQTGTVNVK